MTRFLLLILLSVFPHTIAKAEIPDDFRTEQIYLVADKTEYNIEDTIHIEGIVTCLANDHSIPYSRILYVELINPRTDSVVIRQKITCTGNGLFKTSILPELDIDRGDFFLRAYTRLMQNFSPETFALRHLTIGAPEPTDDGVIDDDIECQIVPMGNHLISETPQQIVALLTTHPGNPIQDQKLSLISSTGDTIQECHTSPSGYAVFNFIPRSGENYKLHFSAMGVNKIFPVSAPDSDGCHITGAISGHRLRFAIEGKIPESYRILSFDRCNGLSEISTKLPSGVTTLQHAPTGPVTIFLTNRSLEIISQISLLPKTDFNPKISVPDTLSVDSPVDLSLEVSSVDSVTILSHFVSDDSTLKPLAEYELAASDFDSPLPLPFRSLSSPEAAADFQAWLGTATFRRFNLADVTNRESPVYRYMPEQIMSISGIVYDDDNAKHPMKGGRLIAYNGANRMVSDTCVSKNGRFTVEVSDFKDGTEFFLQAINSKGVIIRGVIKIDDSTYPAIGNLPSVHRKKSRYANSSTTIDAEEKGNSPRSLPNITVNARAIQTVKRNDKKFYGARYFDQELFEKHNSITVLDALRRMGFIRVVQVKEEGGEDKVSYPYYQIQSTRIPTNLSAGAGEIPIIFDGTWMETKDSQFIFYLPVMQIESIEHLNAAEALIYTHRNFNGAILITTKRVGQTPSKDAKGLRCWPPGLAENSSEPESVLKAPNLPGNYRLVVDIVSHDGNVKSISRRVHVTPSSPARGD